MNKTKTHIYFVPGMAAGKEIFSNISFPEDSYIVHIIEWIIPDKKESIASYAQKMSLYVKESDSVLIGVSFGGVIAQEMSLFLNLKKLIIISSIKSKYELPKRLQFVKKTKAYKLMPTRIIHSESDLSKYAIGPKTKKKLSLYQKYFSVRDKQYLDWAIQKMISWNREKQVDNVIHIHGDNDHVFPIKNIKDCIVIPNGTHIMIINKYRWLNKNLPNLIEGEN